jgi:hypothetical protein
MEVLKTGFERAADQLITPSQTARERSRNIIRSPEVRHDRGGLLLPCPLYHFQLLLSSVSLMGCPASGIAVAAGP